MLKLTRFSPASRKSSPFFAGTGNHWSSSARSSIPGMDANARATSSSTPFRSSGSPPVSRIFADSQLRGNPDDPLDFLETKGCAILAPIAARIRRRIGHVGPAPAIKVMSRLGLGQAVHAAEIAAVSNADAQVAQNAAVRINQWSVIGHQYV